MPDKPVTGPAVNFAGVADPATGDRVQKNHLFPAANTGLPELRKHDPRLARGISSALARASGWWRSAPSIETEATAASTWCW